MSGIVSIILSAVSNALASVAPGNPWLQLLLTPAAWATVGACCIVFAAYQAWGDERRRMLSARDELVDIRALQKAPQIDLRILYDQALFLENGEDGADAHNIRLLPISAGGQTLSANEVFTLKQGRKVELVLTLSDGMGGKSQGHALATALNSFEALATIPVAVEFTDKIGDQLFVAGFEIHKGLIPPQNQIRHTGVRRSTLARA